MALLSIPIFKRSIEGIIFAFLTALVLEVMVCLLLLLIRVPIVLIKLVPLLRPLPLPLIHLLHVFLKLRERVRAAGVALIWTTAAEILEKLFSLSLELLLVVKATFIVKGILVAFSIFVRGFTSVVFLLLPLLLLLLLSILLSVVTVRILSALLMLAEAVEVLILLLLTIVTTLLLLLALLLSLVPIASLPAKVIIARVTAPCRLVLAPLALITQHFISR